MTELAIEHLLDAPNGPAYPLSATPLGDALRVAQTAALAAEQAWQDDESCIAGCFEGGCACGSAIATREADTARDRAREALAASTEPRPWRIRYLDESDYTETVQAGSADDALELARASVRDGDWDRTSTIWIDVEVVCELTDEHDRTTVTLQPPAPKCASGRKHDWLSPIALVGGIAENPGVWGHGGGVRIHEVCGHCGAHRHTDTWAQRPDTGEQGLESVSYAEPDAATRAWVADRR